MTIMIVSPLIKALKYVANSLVSVFDTSMGYEPKIAIDLTLSITTSLVRNIMFGLTSLANTTPLFVVFVTLFCSPVTAMDEDTPYRFDPTKRIPLLTEGNWVDWSWRISAALSTICGVTSCRSSVVCTSVFFRYH